MFGALVVGCLNICPDPVRHVRQSTKYSPEIKPQFTEPQTLKLHVTYKKGEKTVSFQSKEHSKQTYG